jgi:formylglycine-generating enzyme required for sulfatase activity
MKSNKRLNDNLSAVKTIIQELDEIYANTPLQHPVQMETGEFAQLVETQTREINRHIDLLEQQQTTTQNQINKLAQAKIKLEKLLHENSQLSQEEQSKNKQLQQQLHQLIQKKEQEFNELKQQIEQVALKAEQEKHRLLAERDTAKKLYEQQQKLLLTKKQRTERPISKIGYFFMGLLGGLLVVVALAFALPYLGYPIDWSAVLEQLQHNEPSQTNDEPPPPTTVVAPLPPKKPVLKALYSFQDRLNNGGLAPMMVQLPAGEFSMGSQPYLPYPDEIPPVTLQLQSFAISRTEITFEDYALFAQQTHRPLPKDPGWGQGKQPVTNVSWHDAVAYTGWLSEQTAHQYRLPSEREWEYAAGAGRAVDYAWGAALGKNQGVCSVCASLWDNKQPASVGSFAANPLGLHDMTGNVAEWTLECRHRNYQNAPSRGQTWTGGDCSKRMVRGGSFRSYQNDLRITRRMAYPPNARSDDLGFRVVRLD